MYERHAKNKLPFSFISHNKVETNKHINRLCISGFCFVSVIDISSKLRLLLKLMLISPFKLNAIGVINIITDMELVSERILSIINYRCQFSYRQ
jgi:hypothetical protein